MMSVVRQSAQRKTPIEFVQLTEEKRNSSHTYIYYLNLAPSKTGKYTIININMH